MGSQEKLVKEIKSLSDSIRRKNRALRLGINERDKYLETTFKPIIVPIKELSQKIPKTVPSGDSDRLWPISKSEIKDGLETQSTYNESEGTEEFEDSEEDNLSDEEEIRRGDKNLDISREDEDTENEVENPSEISKLGMDIVSKGELGRKYLLKMLHSAHNNRKYHVYGARLEGNGLMIGNNKLDIDEFDNIHVGNKKYKGTPGLFELIFKNKPEKYNNRDLVLFKNICSKTNLHRKGYSSNSPIHRNKSAKYTNIISELFPTQVKRVKRRAMSSVDINTIHKRKRKEDNKNHSGEGLFKDCSNTNIIYYNNANKLIDRMRLLHEAIEAGHTGLENEWVALVDELRNRRIIV